MTIYTLNAGNSWTLLAADDVSFPFIDLDCNQNLADKNTVWAATVNNALNLAGMAKSNILSDVVVAAMYEQNTC